jgi:hypothetical protein
MSAITQVDARIPDAGDPAGNVFINELELLHAGLGMLMARYLVAAEPCLALWVSRQLRLIANHPELPDKLLRPLYLTMAARWQVRASLGLSGELLSRGRRKLTWLETGLISEDLAG